MGHAMAHLALEIRPQMARMTQMVFSRIFGVLRDMVQKSVNAKAGNRHSKGSRHQPEAGCTPIQLPKLPKLTTKLTN